MGNVCFLKKKKNVILICGMWSSVLQFIIGEDGSCGMTYEHAPAEGPPIVALIDHVVEYM